MRKISFKKQKKRNTQLESTMSQWNQLQTIQYQLFEPVVGPKDKNTVCRISYGKIIFPTVLALMILINGKVVLRASYFMFLNYNRMKRDLREIEFLRSSPETSF